MVFDILQGSAHQGHEEVVSIADDAAGEWRRPLLGLLGVDSSIDAVLSRRSQSAAFACVIGLRMLLYAARPYGLSA